MAEQNSKVKPIRQVRIMFEKVKQAIHVGRHVTDLMRLPCVYSRKTSVLHLLISLHMGISGRQYFIGEPEVVSGRDLEPIPLTPEILEKNGFYFGYTSNEEDIAHSTIAVLSEEDKGYVWDEGAGSIKIIFPTESNGGLVELDDQSFNRHLLFVFCDNLYVHELQHALKLCGIDKEIVL